MPDTPPNTATTIAEQRPAYNPHVMIPAATLYQQIEPADGSKAEHAPRVPIVLDARWNFGSERPAFTASRLPQARYFDIEQVCDQQSALPHMVAPDFHAHKRRLGIASHDTVVVYDSPGVFSAARAWWDLASHGHDVQRLFLLEGGFNNWEYRKETTTPHADVPLSPAETSAPNPLIGGWVDRVHVRKSLGTAVIIDARPEARFHGTIDEPRPGLRKGHIPTAINLPFTRLLSANNAAILPKEDLLAVCLAASIDPHALAAQGDEAPEIIVYCGSGITACIVTVALHQFGVRSAVYDGSWSEWGMDGKNAEAIA
ncbi:MAG: sulfurtransferase [Alphaproteobacteria bacterium]|nr:sulfurtransferase [Alphaproteobacteria bacterium]